MIVYAVPQWRSLKMIVKDQNLNSQKTLHVSSSCVKGFEVSNIFHLPTFQNSKFLQQKTVIYDLEENCQIHLPDWQFYSPWTIGLWDMLSPSYEVSIVSTMGENGLDCVSSVCQVLPEAICLTDAGWLIAAEAMGRMSKKLQLSLTFLPTFCPIATKGGGITSVMKNLVPHSSQSVWH